LRRRYIPKPDGRQRPPRDKPVGQTLTGIAAPEDKIVQRAVVEVLNAIYEEDFLGFSYRFRSGRGFVARIGRRAKLAPRIHFHERRTYCGRPSSSMWFSEATAIATSVVCRPSVRERSASPITRL
jgi:hypothetical protein